MGIGVVIGIALSTLCFYIITYNKDLFVRKIVEIERDNRPESQKGGFLPQYSQEELELQAFSKIKR